MQNEILILTGHSGSGKDTISQILQDNGHYSGICPHATRAMRSGEEEGKPYHFTTVSNFKSMIDNGEFVEHASYVTQFDGLEDTAYYGTAYASIPDDRPSVITIGVLAGIELKKRLGDRATLVYVHVDDDIRELRAMERGSFDKIEWDNRLAQDHKRFANGLPEGIDAQVNNMQSIEQTVMDVLEIPKLKDSNG